MHKFFKYLSVFCVLGALVTSSAFANLIFTTPDQVLINMDGIYVDTGEGLQPVQSITEIEEGYLLAVPKMDTEGIYIFEDDIMNHNNGIEAEKVWKCPYCNHWWPIGQKCKNPKCPTNQW